MIGERESGLLVARADIHAPTRPFIAPRRRERRRWCIEDEPPALLGTQGIAVTHGVSVASSSNVATYTSVSFTPVTNDLLVATVCVTGSVAADWAFTDSLGGTWTKVRRQVYTTSANILEIWTRETLSTGAAQTVTFSHPTGNASGCIFHVERVSGAATPPGEAAGQGGEDNLLSGVVPAPVLSTNPAASSAIISAVAASTGTQTTAPTGYTILASDSYTIPSNVMRTVWNTGITGGTITWGGVANGTAASIALEILTAAGGGGGGNVIVADSGGFASSVV